MPKLSKDYVSQLVCPITREILEHDEVFDSLGVCPRCGNISKERSTHFVQVCGRFTEPTLWESLIGIAPKFHPSGKEKYTKIQKAISDSEVAVEDLMALNKRISFRCDKDIVEETSTKILTVCDLLNTLIADNTRLHYLLKSEDKE